VIVNAGARGASILALDKNNGNVIWKSQSDEAGYSSAVISEAGGLRQYVVLTGEAAVGVSAENGELFWRYERVSNRTANIATPIVAGDHVFVSSDYGTGCALLKLSREGNRIKADEVYFNRDMRNHYSSSVLVGDYLYGYSSSILTAMRFATGEVAWRDRSVGKGQVIVAEGRLYLFGENGVAGLAEATPAGYREISRFEIARTSNLPTWALPAIAGGKLYLRDQGTLYSYDIRAN
jgi:outer membrane protein assembly factor BamB